MVVPAVVLALSGRLVTVAVGHLNSTLVVMVMLVHRDRAGDVADLMGIPGGRRRGDAERDRREGEQVAEESKSGRHGRQS